MKIRWFLAVILSACLCAQEVLNNDTVLKLVKAGLGDDVIVGMVSQQPGRYLLTADGIIALKTPGVSDRVISAMIVRNGASGVAYPAPGPATSLVPAAAASSAPLHPARLNAHPTPPEPQPQFL